MPLAVDLSINGQPVSEPTHTFFQAALAIETAARIQEFLLAPLGDTRFTYILITPDSNMLVMLHINRLMVNGDLEELINATLNRMLVMMSYYTRRNIFGLMNDLLASFWPPAISEPQDSTSTQEDDELPRDCGHSKR